MDLATGDPAGAGWVLLGPGPFWAAGLIGALRQPGRRSLAVAARGRARSMVDSCLDDVVTAAGGAAAVAWIVALIRNWAGSAAIVAGLG